MMRRARRLADQANRTEKYRAFYAKLICSAAKLDDPNVEEAFRCVDRLPFAGPPPWWVGLGTRPHVVTPDGDPAFLYQDLLVALDPQRNINIGQPSAHAFWLGACKIKRAQTVIQVGTGSGYYTAILAHLVGENGRVYAYEIDEALAARARENLKDQKHVQVRAQSGVAADLPRADLIYVCAGAARPCRTWLDALRPRGRLMFPLAPEGVLGGMLLIRRPEQGFSWPARFVSRAGFIGCVGLQDEEAGRRLDEAFSKSWEDVRSLRLDNSPDGSCWFAGGGWWLSTVSA